MNKIDIITENTADLYDGCYLKNTNTIVPLSFAIGGTTYRKEEDISIDDFYEKLKNGERVFTSQANLTDVKKVLVDSLEKSNDVIYIAFSSGMSGGCNNIMTMAEDISKDFPNQKLTIVDSISGGGGQGLLVYYANKLKEEGKSYDEIVSLLNEKKHNIHHLFILDDLTNIKNSGRISAIKTFIGALLKIKPILTIDDNGKVAILSKSIGKKKAMLEMVKLFKDTYVPEENDFILIGHTNQQEEANKLIEILKPLTSKPIESGCINKLVSANAGYGALALYYIGKRRNK